jgi:hypothetical protein
MRVDQIHLGGDGLVIGIDDHGLSQVPVSACSRSQRSAAR